MNSHSITTLCMLLLRCPYVETQTSEHHPSPERFRVACAGRGADSDFDTDEKRDNRRQEKNVRNLHCDEESRPNVSSFFHRSTYFLSLRCARL